MIRVKKYGTGPGISVDLKKLMPEETAFRIEQWKNAREARKQDRARFIRNKRVTIGIGFDQWRDIDAASLLEEGREPRQYNLITKYVHGISGNYILNSYDPKFIDREADNRDTFPALSRIGKIYLSDKSKYSYTASRNQCIFYGVQGGGVEEIRIYRDNKEPRGRIYYDPVRFDLIDFDPSNITDRISRKSKEAWKTHYLSFADMYRNYPWAEKDIRRALRKLKDGDSEVPDQYQETTIGMFEQDIASIGIKWRVIEHFHMEQEKVEITRDKQTGIELPDTGYDYGTAEDFMAKQVWAAEKGILLMPDNIQIVESYKPVLYVTTFCPDHGLLLENRKDERQFGHLPFYVWAYGMHDGKCIGIPDIAYNAQDDINKRESAKTKIIAASPSTMKPFIHPLAYGTDIQKKENYLDNANDPSTPFEYDADCPPEFAGKLIGFFQAGQIPTSILHDEQFKVTMLDDLANFNPVLQGRTERSGESGLHYGRKVMESLINHRYQLETLVQHEKDKAEDWFDLAIQHYGGRDEFEEIMNYNREFNGGNGTEAITANDFLGTDMNGQPIVINKIKDLKNTDIIITQSKENDFQKQAKLETSAEIMRATVPTETNGIVLAAQNREFTSAVTYSDEEQKAVSMEAAELYYQIEKTRAQTILAGAQAELMGIQQQQMAAQQAMQGGGGMGGAPAAPQMPGGGGAPPDMPQPQEGLPQERMPLQNQQGVNRGGPSPMGPPTLPV